MIRFFIKKTSRAYLLLEFEGEILLIKNWLGRQEWGLPGGGVKNNEKPQKAAVRETKEELGIEIDSSSLEFVVDGRWQSDRLGYKYYIFKSILSSKDDLKLDKFEIINAKWVPLERIEQYQLSPDILKILP